MSVNGDNQDVSPRAFSRVDLSPPPDFRPEDARHERDVEPLVREETLDEQLDRVRSWAIKSLVALGALALLALACFATLLVAWRWVLYGVRRMRDGVIGHFSDMYRWLDQYSPSETEEEREEKFQTLRARVSGLMAPAYFSWLPEWSQLDKWDWLLFVAVVVLVAGGLYGTLAMLARAGRKALLRVRGVQLEAMQPGSFFTPAQIPACQVQVLIPGLLMDMHQGYGTRVQNYLVTNAHVISTYTELILRGPSGKKILITPSFVKSRLSEDLVYVNVGSTVFTQLGAQSAKGFAKNFTAGFATCVGPSGASTGRVSKSSIRGKLIYEGSTVPGMSGAPYLMQGGFVGIHQGASGHSNLGISAEIVRVEMPRLVDTEAIHGPSPPDGKDEKPTETYTNKFSATWNVEDLDRVAEDRYANDSWADYAEEEDFWTRKLEFEAKAKTAVTAFNKINITRADGSLIQVPLSQQNPGGGEVLLDLASAKDMDYLASLRVGKIVERVESLEKELADLRTALENQAKQEPEQPSTQERKTSLVEPAKRFPCEHCGTICKNELRLERHVQASHTKLESALYEDTGKKGDIIQQRGPRSFLGRRPSPPRNPKNSSGTSNTKDKGSVYRSLEENLSLMLASQRSTETLLKKFLEVSAGRASGITRNSSPC